MDRDIWNKAISSSHLKDFHYSNYISPHTGLTPDFPPKGASDCGVRSSIPVPFGERMSEGQERDFNTRYKYFVTHQSGFRYLKTDGAEMRTHRQIVNEVESESGSYVDRWIEISEIK